MTEIISLAGFIGSGKGTVGDILVEEGYKQLSFAGKLKDAVSVIFGWPRHLLEGDTKESRDFRETVDEFWSNKFGYEVTPRLILQKFGTDALRNNLLDSIWVDSLELEIQQYDKVVITDVRFPNEIEFITKLGGIIVEIDRIPNRPEWYPLLIQGKEHLKLRSDIHPSEYEWFGNPKITMRLYNNGSMEEFRTKIKWKLLGKLYESDPVIYNWEL